MDTNVDYQTRRRLQNRVAQQRFREKSRRQVHPDSSETDLYSSSELSERHSGGQMGHMTNAATIATWPQTSLPPLTPSSFDSRDLSQRPLDFEGSPLGQITLLPPIGLAGDLHDDELCLYTPPPSEICFDLETLAPLGHDMSISQTQAPGELKSGNRMPATYSPATNPPPDGTEDIFQTLFADSQDQCGPEIKNISNDKAAVLLQKQKLHLGKQAEELIRKLISIYDLGVSLEIFPSDPYLRQVLETTDTRFSSICK
ncbi:hypothetical protein BDW74DRAFT_174051 [Aspergillus multicolor]|uniref:bZIP transcription factor n=1 Tax=Aspergillus multicolor TaxID=41759 RepID=UPI003CCC93EA